MTPLDQACAKAGAEAGIFRAYVISPDSRSYPYLALAREQGLVYGAVLDYAAWSAGLGDAMPSGEFLPVDARVQITRLVDIHRWDCREMQRRAAYRVGDIVAREAGHGYGCPR